MLRCFWGSGTNYLLLEMNIFFLVELANVLFTIYNIHMRKFMYLFVSALVFRDGGAVYICLMAEDFALLSKN